MATIEYTAKRPRKQQEDDVKYFEEEIDDPALFVHIRRENVHRALGLPNSPIPRGLASLNSLIQWINRIVLQNGGSIVQGRGGGVQASSMTGVYHHISGVAMDKIYNELHINAWNADVNTNGADRHSLGCFTVVRAERGKIEATVMNAGAFVDIDNNFLFAADDGGDGDMGDSD